MKVDKELIESILDEILDEHGGGWNYPDFGFHIGGSGYGGDYEYSEQTTKELAEKITNKLNQNDIPQFTVTDTLNNREADRLVLIDQFGKVWYDTDPMGLDMSGKRKIIRDVKNKFKIEDNEED